MDDGALSTASTRLARSRVVPLMIQTMRPPPPIASRQFGAFSRTQALAAGWTRSALAHGVQSGQLRRLRRGAFVQATSLDGNDLAAARRRFAGSAAGALLVTPAAVASHATAAVLAGLPVWLLPERPCLTVPPRHTGDADGVHLHRATLNPNDLRPAGALMRTSTARTVCDLAREHGAEDAVIVADAALRRQLITPAQLDRCLQDCALWPGIRRARAAVALADGRAESPLESISRLRLTAAGVPRPDLQPELYDANGRWLGRPDFYWDDYGVVGEVDGKMKYVESPDRAVLWAEKQRQERFEETGLVVVRWGYAQLNDLPRLVDRLYHAFGRGGRRMPDDRNWIARRRAA